MKKGISELGGTPVWLPILLVVGFLAIIFMLMIEAHQLRAIDYEEMEVDLLDKDLVYSCFAFEDARTYPGIIDFNKFKEQVLTNCVGQDMLVKASLDLEKENIEIFNDEVSFKEDEAFCKYEKFHCYEKAYYVILKNTNLADQGLLKIKVIKNE
jgi:hypothetical protein